MYIVTGKKNGIVWDIENNTPLARFKDSKFTTTNKKTATKLEKLGFTVAVEGKENPTESVSEKAGNDSVKTLEMIAKKKEG